MSPNFESKPAGRKLERSADVERFGIGTKEALEADVDRLLSDLDDAYGSQAVNEALQRIFETAPANVGERLATFSHASSELAEKLVSMSQLYGQKATIDRLHASYDQRHFAAGDQGG